MRHQLPRRAPKSKKFFHIEAFEQRLLFVGDFIQPVFSPGFAQSVFSPDQQTLTIDVLADKEDPNYTGGEPSGTITVGWWGGPVLASAAVSSTPVAIPLTLDASNAGTRVTTGNYIGDHVLYVDYSDSGDFASTTFTADDFASFVGEGVPGYGVQFNAAPTSKLQITRQPSSVDAGEKISPSVHVELLNSAGKVSTTGSTAVTVTLASTGTGNGTLTGTTSEKTVRGTATFNNLSVDKAGQYTLTFTDPQGDATTSAAFNVSGGKLVFHEIPKEGVAGTTIEPAVQVRLETSKGMLITNSPGNVMLSISGTNSSNPITGNTVALVKGVAVFSSLKLALPGTYTLNASDDQNDTAAMSNPIEIKGYHLAFAIEPGKAGVGGRLRYAIALEDPKNKVVRSNSTDGISLTLNTIEGGENAALSSVGDILVRGVAINDDTKMPITINSPGTYTLTASFLNGSTTSVPSPYTNVTESATSKQFVIAADHLVFKKQPLDTLVNLRLQYVVALEDYQKHVIETSSDQINFTLKTISGGAGVMLAASTDSMLAGLAENSGTIPLSINVTGEYVLSVVDAQTNPSDPIAQGVSSMPFKIKALKN